jgi:predicted Zn-dependent peptidase
MNRKFDLRILVALFACFACLAGITYSQADAEKQVTEYDVNGLKVLVKRRANTPTVAVGLFIRGGSRALTPQNAGIENFMLNAATEGGKLFPRDVLRKEQAATANVIGSGSNRDFSVISLGSTKGNFDRGWKMFTDVALNPAFAPEDVERIRGNIINGLRSQNDSPDAALGDLVERTVYTGTAYAPDPSGTIENVSRFKAADLAAWHKQVMQTSRLLLVVVGDVDPANIQKLVAASFGTLPRGNYKDAAVPSLDFSKGTVEIEDRPVQTDYVQGSFAAPAISDPDYYAMRVAVSILQTQVYQEVRVKRNLSYAPDAGLGSAGANTGYVYVTSTDPNRSVGVMLDAIRDLQKNEVTEDTIRQYGSFFLTTYYLGQEANAAQAAELARYELVGGGWRNSIGLIDRLRRVTPAEVKAAAQKYMRNIRWSVIGNPADIDRSVLLQTL